MSTLPFVTISLLVYQRRPSACFCKKEAQDFFISLLWLSRAVFTPAAEAGKTFHQHRAFKDEYYVAQKRESTGSAALKS